MDRVRILFMPFVDADNLNAQSLNVREIALRLDPQRFQITLWFEREADPRLQNIPGIRLEKLPPRRRTLPILREMCSGYDVIAYMDYSPASYLFLHLPRSFRRRARAVLHAEAPVAQLVNPSRTLRFLYNSVFSRCDFYTGITEFVARDITNRLGRNASYILPVGVDTKFFVPPSVRAHAVPIILFAGTVIERKGPQIVLEAARRFPNAMFRIVGAAREGFDEVLRQRVAQLNMRNVTFEGAKSQSQLLEIMHGSDIFLLPSRLEGMPRVSLEAAATGLPCVLFRDYQTPSVIDGVTGFQVGTNEEMMQALEKLITDSSLRHRMEQAARKHVESFSWDLVSRHWQNAYLEIATSRVR